MSLPITIQREDTILTITFVREATDDEHVAHLARLHDIMEEGKATQIYRWVVINDVRVMIHGSAMHRRRQADWMVAHDEELRHRTAGVGFVITSALVRGGLTAVLWLSPLPCPHAVLATMDEARKWASERARQRISGLARPPRLRTG